MADLRVLFIGGSGIISSACSRLAAERGIDLSVLNRGATHLRPLPPGGAVLHGDIRDPDSRSARLLGDLRVRRGGRLGRVHPRARPGRHRRCSAAGPGSTCSSVPRRRTRRRRPGCRSPSPRRCATRSGILPGQDRLRGPAGPGLPGGRLSRPRSCGRRTPTTRPWCRLTGAGRRWPGCAQGKPVIVHGDGTSLWTLTHQRRLRARVRAAARPPAHGRRRVPHHLRRRADLGPDRPGAGRRGRARPPPSCTCRRT